MQICCRGCPSVSVSLYLSVCLRLYARARWCVCVAVCLSLFITPSPLIRELRDRVGGATGLSLPFRALSNSRELRN